MKNIKYLLLAFVVLAGLSACDQTDDEPMVGTYNPPAFIVPSSGSSYVLTEAGQDNLIEVMEWEPADFGFQAAVTYTIEMDAMDGDFSEPVEVGTSNLPELRVHVKELNIAAVEFLEPEVPGEVQLRLKAFAHNDLQVLYSDPVTIEVTTYSTVKEITPLFIVGSILGDKVWDNSNYTYIMFRDNNDPNDFNYTYTGQMKAGGFKLVTELGTWDSQYGLSEGELVANDGGSSDIPVEADGYYTFSINIKDLTYSIESFNADDARTYTSMALIGEFNGWGDDLFLNQSDYDPHIWVLDDVELPAGELKFRAESNWDLSWGGGDSFPYGKTTGDNIVVEEGTYFVKFNDLSKHYVFYKKQ